MTILAENPAVANNAAPDRRVEQRRRSYKGATLNFNSGFGSFDCIVRNQSAHGARLSFGDIRGVPNRFELRISGEAAPRIADVRWRQADALGVSLSGQD